VNHTKEPWIFGEYGHIRGDDKGLFGIDVQGFSLAGSELAKENARRIVASVNACAGISTESLERFNEQHKPKNGFGLHRESMLEAQRDELLEELKIASGLIKEICRERGIPRPEYSLTRMDSAIAKCEAQS
jgi:hypothetical protein